MYKHFFKRLLDIVLSGIAIVVLFPLLIILTCIGAIAMKGNPFFVYPRVGRNEKIFNLIKFRSMANLKDKDGNYLPDEVRLNKYGRILRSTSLDELPELVNIFVGDMSIVGPRPLTYKYLDYYTEKERHRHDVRPGLTGLAQVNGRNALSWNERFEYDLEYINSISFYGDIQILIQTVAKVVKRADIGEGNTDMRSLHEVREKQRNK